MKLSTTLSRPRANRVVIYVLEHWCSEHIKRIIFFGSLFPYAMQLSRLKKDVLDKLNQHMDLARTGSALLFPATFRNTIWKNANLEGVITPDDIAHEITSERALEISRNIVTRTPSYLRYASFGVMVKEVKDMIYSGQALVTPAMH